ncbi:PVC-type heme-binding CxxCH protein [Zavarzinella formosa]|uniref:PVC-type heme-binding CxxCH protein n=1 Tax=Zavarzinella formosa TaxID=360055 RepID=UPI0002D77318|nr:PVC-type heme-binding CxxCH protein [Zavarzinella formosa]
MRSIALVLLALVFAVPHLRGETKTTTVKLNGHTFTLPEGFTIELAAKIPLVDRPIVASFDDKGRLYVADSSGSNERPAEQLKNPTHRIMRLEDTNGDGIFDKSTVFADKMMFPEGILWHRGSVYVGAPPHIWKLTDTDDDGKADKREIWFDGKTVTGCANDLHGPYLGPDGYIYWCKGAFAKQEYTLPNGKKFTTRASHIFRAKPDGTGIEPVMTGGMDNPVGMAFLPNGERFFSCTFFQHPGNGQRDGLIHAIYGGIYGKDHDVIYDPDHKWTSPNLMPVMTHLGPAAPAGLLRVGHTLYATQFNMRKVSKHVLKPTGSTYTTEDSNFVVSDNQDFHPTDVLEEADGSILVVDTGGWYKLCCPSSQLVKTDVLGAIYRVRKADKKYDDEAWNKKAWPNKNYPVSKLIYYLLEFPVSSPFVQRLIESIAGRGDESIEVMAKTLLSANNGDLDDTAWANAIRVAIRIDSPASRELVRKVVAELTKRSLKKDGAFQASAHALGLWRDKSDVPALLKMLQSDNLITRRMAAEALGRIGDESAVPGLLEALAPKNIDRTLEHALTYALIEIGSDKATAEGLKNPSITVRRCVMIARDQLGLATPAESITLGLKSPDAAFQEAVWWIISRHPESAEQLSPVIRERLTDTTIKPAEWNALAERIAKLAGTPVIQQLLADLLPVASPAIARERILPLMRSAVGREMPRPWQIAFEGFLAKPDGELTDDVLQTVRRMPAPKVDAAGWNKLIQHIATNAKSEATRVLALASVIGGANTLSDQQAKMVFGLLVSPEAKHRSVAADVLARSKWSEAQLLELVRLMPSTTLAERDRVLAAFQQSTSETLGLEILKQLQAPGWRTTLRVDQVRGTFAKYPEAVKAEAEKLNAHLNADLKQQTATLDALAKRLPAGDIRRGQAVFNSAKTSCIACHTLGYVGGKIGPDLTRIGSIRNERDLLESIVFPSASFVRSYEPVSVKTSDGRVFNGVPKKDAPDELILTLAADKEIRIDRKEIEELTPGKVSIMPAGLAQQVTEQELADLIAFLRNCK